MKKTHPRDMKPGKLYFLEKGIYIRKTKSGEVRYGISYTYQGQQIREIVGPSKTLANEDHSALFRLSDVESGVRCQIDQATHGQVSADTLSSQFNDRDGDGLSRFTIYDYGPGDRVTIKNIATMR